MGQHKKATEKKHDNKSHNKKHDGGSHAHSNPAEQPEQGKKTNDPSSNSNLTKRDLKMIEKLHAKIEFHEIRDEHAEVEKLKEQITKIEENANNKAAQKAEKTAVKTK